MKKTEVNETDKKENTNLSDENKGSTYSFLEVNNKNTANNMNDVWDTTGQFHDRNVVLDEKTGNYYERPREIKKEEKKEIPKPQPKYTPKEPNSNKANTNKNTKPALNNRYDNDNNYNYNYNYGDDDDDNYDYDYDDS